MAPPLSVKFTAFTRLLSVTLVLVDLAQPDIHAREPGRWGIPTAVLNSIVIDWARELLDGQRLRAARDQAVRVVGAGGLIAVAWFLSCGEEDQSPVVPTKPGSLRL